MAALKFEYIDKSQLRLAVVQIDSNSRNSIFNWKPTNRRFAVEIFERNTIYTLL